VDPLLQYNVDDDASEKNRKEKGKNNDNKGEEWSIIIVATAHGDYPLLFATLLYSNNAATANNKATATAIQEGPLYNWINIMW